MKSRAKAQRQLVQEVPLLSPAPSPASQGGTVTSEYEILERVATGAFGIVFKVRRITDQQLFVLKRIPLLDLTALQRCDAAQEVGVVRGLHHPCVAVQHDAFLYNKQDLCLVMDYYDGGDMDARLAAQRELDAYFDFRQVMLWFVQLVLGTQYLHAHHVIHRDIKTHNVFLRERDASVVLGDFGISERLGLDMASRTWASVTVLDGPQGSSATFSSASMPSGPTRVPPSPLRMNLKGEGVGSPLGAASGAAPSPASRESCSLLHASYHRQVIAGVQGPSSAAMDWSWNSCENGLQATQVPVQDRRSSGSISSASLSAQGQPHRRHQSGMAPEEGVGAMEAAMKGTPLYMAPEVLQGGAASTKSDVWSLGCVLYELLALRHPFESRDLAPLVMRVSRGQREPLPAHYPKPIEDLLNRMLSLNANTRPSCEEVLTMPVVCAYVKLWLELRTPLDVPMSPSEAALARQVQAWQTNIAEWKVKHPADARNDALGVVEIEKMLASPACSPSEERESVERRAVEAARAALMSAPPQGMLNGALFGVSGASQGGPGCSGDGGGGIDEGTFFFGASGQRLTGMQAGGMHGRAGGGELHSNPSLRDFLPGMSPTESMRPHMVYDVTPEKLSNAATAVALPDCVATRDSRTAAHGDGNGVSTAAITPLTADVSVGSSRRSSHSSPVEPEQWCAQKRGEPEAAHRNKTGREAGGRQRMSSLTSTGSGNSNVGVDRGKLGGGRHFAVDDDAHFFELHHNVQDVRFASIDDIAQAVMDMRERVQQRMRHQRVLMDIAQLYSRHGTPLLHSMPHVLHVLEVAAASSHAATAPASNAPEDVYAMMVRQIDQQRIDREKVQGGTAAGANAMLGADTRTRDGERLPVGRPVPQRIRQLREAAAPNRAMAAEEALHRTRLCILGGARGNGLSPYDNGDVVSYDHTAGSMTLADPAAPLSLDLAHTSPPRNSSNSGGGSAAVPAMSPSMELRRWRPYLERRNQLSSSLLRVFDKATLRAVYTYYRSCAVLQRDPAVVRRIVPDRRKWTSLPSVEELAVLDRRLEPLLWGTGQE